jgi:cell division transport system permease protein
MGMQFITGCISTTLVLILLGAVVHFTLVARNLTNRIKENMTVTLLLQDDVTRQQVQDMKAEILSSPYFVKAEYISKEQALQEEVKAMGSNPKEFLDFNPFSPSMELKMSADYANSDSIGFVIRKLKKSKLVAEVIYQQELMKNVNHSLQRVSLVLLILAALLTLVSFGLINNTIRLSIYARRHLIYTMKLVGAGRGFIPRPFLWRSMLIGIIAAIIADVLFVFGAKALLEYEPTLDGIITPEVVLITCVSVFVAGILLTFVCAYLSLSKFLNMRADDLY